MTNRSSIPTLLIILVVGLANAAAFAWGFHRMAQVVEQKQFYSPFGPAHNPAPQTVLPLPNGRFAVVSGTGDFISVYAVDAKGGITRSSDVRTGYKNLEPVERRQKPNNPQ